MEIGCARLACANGLIYAEPLLQLLGEHCPFFAGQDVWKAERMDSSMRKPYCLAGRTLYLICRQLAKVISMVSMLRFGLLI